MSRYYCKRCKKMRLWRAKQSVLGPMVFACNACDREALLPGDERPKARKAGKG